MNRRAFLKTSAAALPWLSWQPLLRAQADPGAREWRAEVVVIGGGLGGCAAALAALRAGCSVVLTEETDWIGGQSTAQAVPPDENPWIESFGCTRSYRQYRDGVRAFYRDHYPLTTAARANAQLNPGNGWVSRLCHEPRVSLAVLQQMLAPYLSQRRLRVLLEHRPVAADTDGDRVRSVTVRDLRGNRDRALTAPYFLDATELGAVLPLTKTEYVIGAESRRDTGEPHAPESANPFDQQAFTCCFAMDWLPGEDHTLAKPAEYDLWRDYVPKLDPAWTGPLLSWTGGDPLDNRKARKLVFDPTLKASGPNLWSYRRIIDAANFLPDTYRSGICLVNWPQNDYLPGPLVDVTDSVAAGHIQRAKQLSLSLLYWMQTAAPRPDGGTGWKGLRLREDIVGTADGLAKSPYIRESRRIRAEFTVLEQHVSAEARKSAAVNAAQEVFAEVFPDSVGIGYYRIDLHPSASGRNYLDLASLPFQIPLGALLPQRMENLLPACKNLGTTHITNGAYRLHPVEWNIGEAAGALAAFCLQRKEPPRQIRKNPQLRAAFQAHLRAAGVELAWPPGHHL